MKKLLFVSLCGVLLTAVFQLYQVAHAQPQSNAVTRLKLLRRVERESFGANLADALRKHPAAGKAYDITGISASPRKGFSFWNAEGGVLVILDYDPPVGRLAPTELALASVAQLNPYISVVISMCCCANGGIGAEGGCALDPKARSLGKCGGTNCCAQSITLIERMGATAAHGASCFGVAK